MVPAFAPVEVSGLADFGTTTLGATGKKKLHGVARIPLVSFDAKT
jgi:hypothetical protein